MRVLKVLLPCLVALAVVLGALAAPASAAAPAQKPTWTQGQSVGYGVHLDIGAIASLLYAGLLTNTTNGPHINKLNITGTLDIWDVDTVTGVTSTVYTLSSQSAEGLKLHFELNLTEQLPVAGTYHGTFPSGCVPTMQNQTIAETFDATVLSTGSGTSNLAVSNLSYLSAVEDASVQARVAFTAYHLPSYNFTFSTTNNTCTETVTYSSPSYTLTVNTQDQIRMLFDPAWNYFDFPISDNKTWWANTNVTVGATLAGTINVQGLSSQDEKSFFENLTKSFPTGSTVSGLSSFPIDLAQVTITEAGVPLITNGVVRDTEQAIMAHLRATSSAQTLSDGSLHPVYLITDASYACPYTGAAGTVPYGFAAVYAPDFPAPSAGMIVGYELDACANGSTTSTYQLKNTKPADAQNNIGRTEQTYAPNPPATANALVDFFTQSPYLGLILVAAVVVVVAALLIFRRRRRPMVAPPGAQPPATPPPASPPPSGPGNP